MRNRFWFCRKCWNLENVTTKHPTAAPLSQTDLLSMLELFVYFPQQKMTSPQNNKVFLWPIYTIAKCRQGFHTLDSLRYSFTRVQLALPCRFHDMKFRIGSDSETEIPHLTELGKVSKILWEHCRGCFGLGNFIVRFCNHCLSSTAGWKYGIPHFHALFFVRLFNELCIGQKD